jgi:ParB-like chromosome segregation protein Spo0J
MTDAKVGFEMRKVRLSLAVILPVRQLKDPQKNIRRYQTIRASIKEVGLVEPLVVHPQKGGPGTYLLLDGHLRLFALKELGETEVDCIIATDDESFTYNARISRLAPIQEHKMIVKAVRNGVKPERIAATLNIPVRNLHAILSFRIMAPSHSFTR